MIPYFSSNTNKHLHNRTKKASPFSHAQNLRYYYYSHFAINLDSLLVSFCWLFSDDILMIFQSLPFDFPTSQSIKKLQKNQKKRMNHVVFVCLCAYDELSCFFPQPGSPWGSHSRIIQISHPKSVNILLFWWNPAREAPNQQKCFKK